MFPAALWTMLGTHFGETWGKKEVGHTVLGILALGNKQTNKQKIAIA
jgi:hypothetical protein